MANPPNDNASWTHAASMPMHAQACDAPLRVSVVVPLYNKAPYIEAALASVMAQTEPVHEVIVVDDGSSDDGPERVRAMNLEVVRLVHQPNGGVSAARNTGIEYATGNLVSFLDADDLYCPGFASAITAMARGYPTAGMLATTYCRRTADGVRTAMRLHRSLRRRGVVGDFYRAWATSSFFCTGSIAVRRELFSGDAALRFPVGESLGEDQDLWFRIAERAAIAFDPVIQAEYRLDVPGSATSVAPVLAPLPCFERLEQRLNASSVPAAMRSGARKLLATHLINVARARRRAGDKIGAAQVFRRVSPLDSWPYWLRTRLALGFGAGQQGGAQ